MVVVEAWFRKPPHDGVLRDLEAAGVDRWVEVWCHAAPETLVARYLARDRHEGHPAAADYVDELAALARVATPMSRSPLLDVDTTDAESIDHDGIARWVVEHLGEAA